MRMFYILTSSPTPWHVMEWKQTLPGSYTFDDRLMWYRHFINDYKWFEMEYTLVIFALRLQDPQFPEAKLIFLFRRSKRSSLSRIGASSPGVWQFSSGPPPAVVLQEELERVQKHAARIVMGNYNYETGIMTGSLGQLKWESLKKRREDNRPTHDLIDLKTRRGRNQHSMAFQTPIILAQMLIKAASSLKLLECPSWFSDFLCQSCGGLCGYKFTSLVRASHFGILPVDLNSDSVSDSDWILALMKRSSISSAESAKSW